MRLRNKRERKQAKQEAGYGGDPTSDPPAHTSTASAAPFRA